MKWITYRLLISLSLAVAGVVSVAVAAPATRSVRGTVRDQDGQPVNRAAVRLKDTRTLAIRSYFTDKDGSYHFMGLDRDVDYVLRATFQGYSSKSKTLTVFDERDIAEVDLVLEVGPKSEVETPPVIIRLSRR